MTVRESSDELTLRAQKVGTFKTHIHDNHPEEETWAPLVDHGWYAFCQALYKGIEREDWGEMYEAEVRHNVLYEAVSIFLLVRQQLQRIYQISAQALRYCRRFEDLGLIDIFTCLYNQKPV